MLSRVVRVIRVQAPCYTSRIVRVIRVQAPCYDLGF